MSCRVLVVGVLAGLLAASGANATVYDFSFSNVSGGVDGTVQGQITLGTGDGTFSAQSILVTAAPAALGYTLSFDVLQVMPSIVQNTFTVTNGAITAYQYGSQNSTDAFTLGFQSFGSLLNVHGSASVSSGVQDTADSTVTFGDVAAVPAPGSLPIMLSGLAGLGLAWRRKREG